MMWAALLLVTTWGLLSYWAVAWHRAKRSREGALSPWLQWIYRTPWFAIRIAREIIEDSDHFQPSKRGLLGGRIRLDGRWLVLVGAQWDTDTWYGAPEGWRAVWSRANVLAVERFLLFYSWSLHTAGWPLWRLRVRTLIWWGTLHDRLRKGRWSA